MTLLIEKPLKIRLLGRFGVDLGSHRWPMTKNLVLGPTQGLLRVDEKALKTTGNARMQATPDSSPESEAEEPQADPELEGAEATDAEEVESSETTEEVDEATTEEATTAATGPTGTRGCCPLRQFPAARRAPARDRQL